MSRIKDYLRKVKRFINTKYHTEVAERRLEYVIRHDELVREALHSTDLGVSETRYCDHEVIVSLTTYGKRLYDVAPVIESIMQGSMKPNRIVLNLEHALEGKPLPIALQNQKKRGLEVYYCKDIRSYKKLLPTMIKYPEAAIITIDDDAIYYYDLVEKLVNAHIESPEHIIANRIHRIKLGQEGRPVGYMDWEHCADPMDDSPLNFATSGGGTLYPPCSLNPEVQNEEVFTKLSPRADDVWFYAMALMNGTRIKKCYTHDVRGEDYIINEAVQDVALAKTNTSRRGQRCENDDQLEAVFDRYNLWGALEK